MPKVQYNTPKRRQCNPHLLVLLRFQRMIMHSSRMRMNRRMFVIRVCKPR